MGIGQLTFLWFTRSEMKSNVLVTLFLVNGLAMLVASLPRDDKCSNCLSEPSTSSLLSAHWAMPLSRLGERQYYLGTFFKANWYKAAKYCRYHGMQLASIETQEENNILEEHVKSFGLAMNISGHREQTR